MDNQDKTNFSLDDDEIVEEEVTERDEEYDDGYEDEYDDEDYADEDYDEGDEEEYADEDYDDGYNDDYYDDRLNKVLDEIAELKRGMVPATIQPQQPIMPPQYIYQPTAPPAGSEVVMYNEISRLRDELAKNSSSLEMQKELTRMKEDMARDQKIAEAQYNAEIQRLQSKIDDLLKNGSGPQSELSEGDVSSTHFEGGKSLDLEKLLSINESILRATRDSDARIQGEIEQLKKQFEQIPSLKELNGAVASVKKAAHSVNGLDSDVIEKLSADVAALRSVIEENGIAAAPVQATPAVASEREDDTEDEIGASELLRQLYDIKSVLGNASQEVVARTRKMAELVNEYKRVAYLVRLPSVPYKNKLTAVYDYAKKLEDSNEPDTVDLVLATGEIISSLGDQILTRSAFADLAAFCAERGITAINNTVRDAAEKFFAVCEKLASAKTELYGDYLPDLVSAINTLENNSKQADNSTLIGDITNALLEDPRDDAAIRDMVSHLIELHVSDVMPLPSPEVPVNYNPKATVAEQTIFQKLDELKAAVQASAEEIAKAQAVATPSPAPAPAVEPEKDSTSNNDNGEAINELLNAVNELKAKLAVTPTAEFTEVPQDMAGVVNEIRSNYVDLSGKLVDISEKIQAPVEKDAPIMTDEEKAQALNDLVYIRGKLDEHEEFFARYTELKSDITEEKTVDVSAQVAEQIGSLLTEINSQFDKLYEDISNVILESEANIVNRIGEGGSADAIEVAKADILAETQAIRDSLMIMSDAVLAPPVSDAIDRLQADVTALNDLYNANSEAAAIDRQKLMDDVAFLREQAELALADGEGDVGEEVVEDVVEDDRITPYLDDISARIDRIVGIADDVALTKESAVAAHDGVATMAGNVTAVYDTVLAFDDKLTSVVGNVNTVTDSVATVTDNIAVLGENVTALGDNLNTINDNLVTVNDNISAMLGSVDSVSNNMTAVNDNISTVAENSAAARDAATATLDALQPITEQLNAILDRFDAEAAQAEQSDTIETEYTDTVEQGGAVGVMSDEELTELKDGLNTILDTLPLFPQADDVVAARDNTYTILDTLANMPSADDVVLTRDNVATILETLNMLSDTVSASLCGTDGAPISEDISALREELDGVDANIAYIRQKLDGNRPDEQTEDLSNIMQDLGLVLDKIEEYERTSASNKQEILDAVSGIKEEIHINSLDETMTAAGMDDETRDAFVNEVAEIRERLSAIESATQSMSDVNTAALDGVTAQLADIQAMLADKAELEADGAESAATNSDLSENMQALFGELTAIRERLETGGEYDTVEEILSLREDVKAARIVDQDEVTGELEAIKNELAAISSGNILDEIRALREDIVNLPGGDGASAPTDGELNLLLNEIVSLRDEVFAFKDEVLNAAATQEPADAESSVEDGYGASLVAADEDIATIMDELTALRADQSALTENIDELKDIISRRTTISSDVDDENAAAPSGNLDVVLDEIINLKNDIDRIEETLGDDKLTAIMEQVDEMRAVLDELRPVAADTEHVEDDDDRAGDIAVDLTPIMEQFDAINATLDDIRLNQAAGGAVQGDGENVGMSETLAERFDDINIQIDELKTAIDDIVIPQPADYSGEIAELRDEIERLKAENAELREANNDAIGAQLAEIKEAIHDMSLASAPVQTEDGDTSYAALIEEIRGLKDKIDSQQQYVAPAEFTFDEDTIQALRTAIVGDREQGAEQDSFDTDRSSLADELGEIRDEIAQLRSLTSVASESGESFASADVAALRDELAEIKQLLSSPDSLFGVAEDVTTIKADVQTLKDEPDLGVMNEILALRDEFQALREQIEDVKRIAGKTDSEADESLMSEVQSLRDQLFAISMANVNDPSSGESNYESYNNLILDELGSIRDQISTAGSASDLEAISDEFAKLKAAMEKRDAVFEALADKVAKMNSDATNDKILDELASLRTDMANQRDADLTTLNFMSEMAHLLERQNQYLTQNAGTKISDEIESLKAELASSDAVAEEVAKLREIMTQSGSASDNETILAELADLREELSSEKPSRENELILDAIARLRDEITVLAEREQVRDISATDADLSDSLSDLKDQLNEIAGIIEPEEHKLVTKPLPEKQPSGNKRGRKPGSKNGGAKNASAKSGSTAKKPAANKNAGGKSASGNKRGRKPGSTNKKPANPVPPEVAEEVLPPVKAPASDFDSLIDEQASKLGLNNDDMSLNPTMTTTDAMDMADKLAKQVANKLIMEQLVEQLGDGGVSEDRVDEILRDILPQEFTTIAETEASDKVRRLANQLVLDKLRARLNGKK